MILFWPHRKKEKTWVWQGWMDEERDCEEIFEADAESSQFEKGEMRD